MDTIIYSVLRITVMVLILRTLFRLFAYPKTKSFRFNQKPTGQESTTNDKSIDEPQKDTAPAEMVVDNIDGSKIPKHQSYILLDSENKPVYFSSWDNRQAYIDKSF